MATANSLESAPGAQSARVRVHCARSLDEVDALAPQWRSIGGQLPSPMAQFGWTRACLATLADDTTPHVVVGLAQRQVRALAPLVKKRLHGVCRLFLAGVAELFEPVDLVWTDGQALAHVFRSLARGGTPLVFERVPADSSSVPALARAYRGRAIVTVRPQPGCRAIAIDDRWLEPARHLEPAWQAKLAHARRAAEALGEVTAMIHTPDLRDLPELLDTALEVEAHGAGMLDASGRRWSVPLARDPQRSVIYRHYARSACVDGTLRVCFLRIGDRVAAMQLAVEQGGALWVLRAGRDAQFAECLPELLLGRATIRYAAESGLTAYEFLSSDAAWSNPWPATERPCAVVHVYPIGVRGLSALVADMAVGLYRRWQSRKSQ